MKSFKDYVLLKENVGIPQDILRPIKEFYLENYKKYLKNWPIKVNEKNFPSKNFSLDFSNTRFEFLNQYNPNVNIYLVKRKAYFSKFDKNKNNTFEENGTGNIYLGFSEGVSRVFSDLVEHEILHYVQYLVKKVKGSYGGIPSKKILPKDISIEGYPKDKDKRTFHARRPIEYYPNLVTAAREIQKLYHNSIAGKENYEDLKNDENNKKNFFKRFLEEYDGGIYDVAGFLSSKILKELKGFSQKIYEKYLKTMYKMFVVGETPYDVEEIRNISNDIGELRRKVMVSIASKYK